MYRFNFKKTVHYFNYKTKFRQTTNRNVDVWTRSSGGGGTDRSVPMFAVRGQ